MNREVYAHLLHTYGRNSLQWVGLACEVIRTLLLRVVIVILMAQIVASIAAGNTEQAQRLTWLFLGAFVAGALVGTLGDLASMRAENETYRQRMQYFYERLIAKDTSFYRDHQTGYLSGAFRQYVDGTILMVRALRGEVTRVAISLTVPVIVLLVANWRVGIVAVAIVIIQIVYMRWASRKANVYRVRSHEVYRKLTGEISDQITNIIAYKSSGMEQQGHRKVRQLIQDEVDTYWLRRRTTIFLDLPRTLATAIATAGALLVVASMTGAQAATTGMVVMTVMYMFQISRNVSELPELIANQDDFVTKIYPTLEYLQPQHQAIRDPAAPKKLAMRHATITLSNVAFSYPSPGDPPERIAVLKDFSLHIEAGEQVGIVGLSGAGKSTLANLIMRFDDVDEGSIAIDDTDIREVAQSELRRNIAYVPQEPLLFHRTIRENIAYFNPDASQAAIVRAAKAAHAHEFIQSLPGGYDTVVGERGIKLSGGQKQRVVIARAILKQAPIMIFDEATSALDSESEQIIQKALPQILGKQTAIIIAHRLSTVAGLDRIIVMHNGQIAEQGSHDALIAQKGRYYSLWQKQTNGTSV